MTIPITIVVLAAVCFLSFVWGAAAHFRRVGPVPGRMWLMTLANLSAFGWFLAVCWFERRGSRPTDLLAHALAGLGVVGAAGLFWWAIAVNRAQPLSIAFSTDVPLFLQQAGPYAYVRHPFYVSYIVFWLASAFESSSLLYWIVPIGMAVLYSRMARLEEAKFAGSRLSDGYRSYKARTGMMVPMMLRRRQTGC